MVNLVLMVILVAASLLVGACAALGGPATASCMAARYGVGDGAGKVSRMIELVCDAVPPEPASAVDEQAAMIAAMRSQLATTQ